MGIQGLGDGCAPPPTHVAGLVAAGDEDAIGMLERAQDLAVAARCAVLEHEGLHRGDAAHLVEEFLADFTGLRCAEDHDVAAASALHEPSQRIEIAVATAHQQQPGLHAPQCFCVWIAQQIVAVVRCLCCQGKGQE